MQNNVSQTDIRINPNESSDSDRLFDFLVVRKETSIFHFAPISNKNKSSIAFP